MFIREYHYLNKQQSEFLLKQIDNVMHQAIVLLMLDGGLRVSEAVSLKFSNFDFKKRVINVQSLKKRQDKEFRTIPLSDRLFSALADYVQFMSSQAVPEAWVFPSPVKQGEHITRFAVSKLLKRLNEKKTRFQKLHPHVLRHSFGSHHIADGTPLENVKAMLGHKKYDTTLVYAQVPQAKLRENVYSVSDKPKGMLKRYFKLLVPEKKKYINICQPHGELLVGRGEEVTKLNSLVDRGVNTIILGDIGVGKSLLLKNICPKKKVLKLDDASGMKKSLVYMLLYLYGNDKEALKNVIFGDFDLDAIEVKLNRESITNLCTEIKRTVEPKEYVLSIDSVDGITPTAVKALESLKDHFHIVCCARSVSINKSSFLWNFQAVKLNPLPRKDAILLIDKLSFDLEGIEDYDLFRTHVFEQSGGNPRVIHELMDRYRKEPILDNAAIRSISHFGSLKELDFTWVIFTFLGCLTVLRYLSRELDNSNLRFVGGMSLVLLLFFKSFTKFTKRKTYKQ